MKKYLVGSQLLNIKSAHDIDYLVIIESDDVKLHQRKYVNGEDLITQSTANLDEQMNFEMPVDPNNVFRYIIGYQMDKDIIGQEFPYEYNILEKRKKYIELLNYIVEIKALNFNKEVNINNWHCSKLIYHIAYLTFILENNSTTLTTEQKSIVQQIHDRQMPVSYLDVLEEKIKNLQ